MGGVAIGVTRKGCGERMTLGRNNNPFKGVNKVCAQCINTCKQFENVVLMNCPKFQSIRTETPLSFRRRKSAVVQNKGVKSGK